jgi:hypothetical protein
MDIASCVCEHKSEEVSVKNKFKYTCLKFDFEISMIIDIVETHISIGLFHNLTS